MISPASLKRYIDKMFKIPSNRANLSYSQFEGLLKEICFSSFLSAVPSDRVQLFFNHINEPSKSVYKTPFIVSMKRRNISNDYLHKGSEEINSSIDLDLTIKEALETLKTKDESFRSSNSGFSREVSPIPSIRSRLDLRPDSRGPSGSSFYHKRPYLNKSVPDSPNTSVLSGRPSSRHQPIQCFKDNELDEFLKTEQMVEKEATVTMNLQTSIKSPTGNLSKGSPIVKIPVIRRIEFSKSKPELIEKKNLKAENSKKNVLLKIEKKDPKINFSITKKTLSPNEKNLQSGDLGTTVNSFTKKHLDIIQNKKIKKMNPDLIEKHRDFIVNDRSKLFSNAFVLRIIFSCWKIEWEKSKNCKPKF